MMMMLLFERSEYDDDDVAVQKIMMMMMFLFKRLEYDDDDVIVRKIRV